MSILVVGSIAFDTVKTPFGEREKALGGAANYFSMAAKFFSPVNMVGVVGDDFPQEHLNYLRERGVNTEGVERAEGKSFHWQCEYGYDLNTANTLKTELNVFQTFAPKLPDSYKTSPIVFLANIDPELQIYVLKQMKDPKVRALDTMNYWIESENDKLKKAISMIDILLINDAEIRALTGEHNIVKAAKASAKMGARVTEIKRGEYGSMLYFDNHIAFVPAYPLEDVFDPTGAGDTFAGGFLGALSQEKDLSIQALKRSMLMGTVMSSYVIERFSFDRLKEIDQTHIEKRKQQLISILHMNKS